MQIQLPMSRRCVAYFTLTAPPGTSEHTLFVSGGTALAESVTPLQEKALVKFLTDRAEFRHLIADVLGLGRSVCWLREKGPPLAAPRGEKPGDIDLLIAPSGSPHLARALEFKRVLVRQNDDLSERLNKVEGVADAFSQAAGLARLGYHEAYMALLVVSDLRRHPSENAIFTDASWDTIQRILDVPDWSELASAVGLVWVEICQATDEPIDRSGRVSLCVLKPPTRLEQSGARSSLVARLFDDQCECGHHDAYA